MKLSEIYEGWRNKLLPPEHLKEVIKKTSEERINICLTCPHHSENKKKTDSTYKTVRPDHHCTYCGCTLSAKTACLSCQCPLKKWVEVMTQEQEEELKKDINGKQGSS